MRTLIACAAALPLAACITSPAPPTADRIRAVHAELVAEPTIGAREFAAAGMYEVDVRCDEFFEAVTNGDRRSRGLQGGARALGGTVAAYLGATNESVEDIAVASLIFSGLDAQISNYRDYEFFGSLANSVRRLVVQARASYRETQPIPTNRIGAIQYVYDYAQICTMTSMLQYINTAVGSVDATVQGGSEFAVPSQLRSAVVAAAGSAAGTILSGLSDAHWARLFVFLRDGIDNPTLRAQFAAEMPAAAAAFVTANGTVTPTGQTVVNELTELQIESASFAAEVQALREALAERQTELNAASQGAGGTRGFAGTAPAATLPESSTRTRGVVVIE